MKQFMALFIHRALFFKTALNLRHCERLKGVRQSRRLTHGLLRQPDGLLAMTKKALFTVGLLIILSASSPAQASTAGSACPALNAVERDGGQTLICNGTVWKLAETVSSSGKSQIQIDNDTGVCNTAKLGRMRYDGISTWDYCNGTAWVALAPAAGGGGCYKSKPYWSGASWVSSPACLVGFLQTGSLSCNAFNGALVLQLTCLICCK